MSYSSISRIVCTLLFVIYSWCVAGRGFSYVYIQGDKKVPFYVKLEDQMLPRYGKNYNIIPQLAPGIINITILFQQNLYPAQTFAIIVPENGFRGFLLTQKGGAFSLYDVHGKFYLHAGNSPEEDNVSAAANEQYVTAATPVAVPPKSVRTAPDDITPNFLPDIQLGKDGVAQEQREEYQPEEEMVENTEPSHSGLQETETEPAYTAGKTVSVINSDCPSAIDNGDFEDLLDKVNSKTEKLKLKYLLSRMDNCYSTGQARILAESLDNDPEKYTFLKRVYPRITDQGNFPALENLLSTQEWKSYFKLIIPR